MKKLFVVCSIVIINLIFTSNHVQAQCDTIAAVCARHILSPFVSDGQQYRALLLSGQTAEFRTTFYGGATYRVAACTGLKDGNLIFSVFDEQHNLLFTNKDFKNIPYWDFKINSTLDIIVEATLDGTQSGCAVIIVGFKQ